MRRWLMGGAALAAAGCVAALVAWAGGLASAASTCSIFWTGHVSSSWNVSGNWSAVNGGSSAGRLPGRSDYVCMSSAPSRSTVSLTGKAVIDGIEWPKTSTVTPVLQISGSLAVGTTEAAFASTIASLQVQGTLSTVTSLETAGLSLESAGTLGGAGTLNVPAGGSLSLADGTLAAGMHLVNHGTATVAQNATLTFTEASVLENAASLSLGDSSTMQLNGAGRVVNAATGTLSYTGSATSSFARIQVPFDNYGSVSVTRGTLELGDGSSQFSAGDTGSYSAATAGVVHFGAGTRTLTNQVSFPGPGQVAVTGQLNLAQGVGLTLSNLLLSGGTLSGRGTLTIPAGGSADLANGTLQGGMHLLNKGTANVAALATINFLEASELQNDDTLNLADSGQLGSLCCGTTSGFLVNEAGATLSYAGSASSSFTTIGVPFDNYGAVSVVKGKLEIASSSSSESTGDTGSYTTAAAGTLDFSGATRTLAASATFQDVGQVTLSQGELGLDAGATLSLSNLLVSGGTLAGHGSIVVPSGGNATLAGGTLAGGFRLVNRGNMTVATGSSVSFTDASVLENAGTLKLSDGDEVGVPCCSNFADGTLIDDSGAAIAYTGSASNSMTAINVSFDNLGTVTVGRGTLALEGGSSSSSAGDGGVYNVAATAFLRFGGTRLLKGSVSFPAAGQIEATGYLDFLGSTTLPSLAWQNATIEVAAGSVLTAAVNGTPSGTLQLDGDRPGHFGSLAATGSLNVASLQLKFSNEAFAPPCGETIPVAKTTSLSGEFTGASDELLPEGASLQTSYASTAAKTLINCPPPPTPVQQTYGTGRSFDASNPSGYFAEPVNTATGAYATEQTDAALRSLGVPFTFTRYYSSNNSSAGPLGPGWSDSLSASLTLEGSTVVLTSENGEQSTFTQQSDGSYLGAPGVRSRLTQTAGGWTVTRRDRSKLIFDSTGRLLSITDGNGVGLELTYNAGGQLEAVKDGAGHTVTFTYQEGLLSSIALPLSRTVHYGYTSSGQLASVTDAAGDVTSYTYNSTGLLTGITDADGHKVVQNVYNSSSQVVSQTNALGQKSTFAYSGESTTFTDARGHKWTDQYSGNVLVRRTDPLGSSTVYAYDANLDLTALTDPNGNTTLMDYDAAGNMLNRTSPAPYYYEEKWTYNALGESLSHVDRRGLKTTYVYDSRGNLLKTTRPGGTSVTNTYSASNGALLSSTTASGHTTAYSYDSAGDLVKVTSPLGEITTYAYDAAGRLTTKVSPRGNASGANPAQFTTTYAYDADDRLLSLTDPLGDKTTTTYDKVGNVLSVTNPDGHTTSHTYDAANHVVTITAADGTTTGSTYDAVGNLVSRTDANGHTTTYTYDAANREIAVKTPLGHTTAYSYDRDGHLIKTVDGVGASATYAYDTLGSLASKTYSDGTPTVKYSYDADSNRISMSDGTGTTTYAYNSRNELTKKTHGGTGFSYTYTSDGLVATRVYPDGLTTTYAYDADGRPASVTSGGQSTTYTHDADGNLTSTVLPSASGVTESRAYDAADRLTGIEATHGATVLDASTITRDAAGNPTAISTPSGPITYSYDSRERVTEACYGASCATNKQTWTYDGVGNRLTSTTGGVTTTNTYDADNELAQSVTGESTTTPTYDADGRLIGYGASSYGWNAANQLVSLGGPHAATYGYDGDGNRVTVTDGGATTTQAWDTNGALPQLASAQGASGTQNYLWGAGSLGFTTSAGMFYELHDSQSSTVGVVSSNGSLQSTATYDPYGVTIATTKPVSTAPSDQIGFQEQLADPSGQYDLRAREYEPAIGQFLSPDPLPGEPDAPQGSAYLYAGDMPTVGSDPSGECALVIFGKGCGGTAFHVARIAIDTVGIVGAGVACAGSDGLGCGFAVIGGVDAANDLYNQINDLAGGGDSGAGAPAEPPLTIYRGNYDNNYYYNYGGNNYSYGGRGPSK